MRVDLSQEEVAHLWMIADIHVEACATDDDEVTRARKVIGAAQRKLRGAAERSGLRWTPDGDVVVKFQ